MSNTIDLPNEVYKLLEWHARVRNLTVPQVIAQFVEEIEAARMAVVLEELRAEGILAEKKLAPLEPPQEFKPIKVQGKPLSEVIIEERR